MGSGFFSPTGKGNLALDLTQATLGKTGLLGPNSFIAKESAYDPLMGSEAGALLDPVQYTQGQAWDARNKPPPGYVAPATPYAGINPSMSAAQTGYSTQQALSAPATGTPGAGAGTATGAAQTGYTPQSYAQQMKAAALQAQATPTNTQNQSRQNAAAANIWG